MPPGHSSHSSHSSHSFSSHSHSSHSSGFGPSRSSFSSHSSGFGPSGFGPARGPVGHNAYHRPGMVPPVFYSRPPRVRVMPVYITPGATYRNTQTNRREENPIRDRVNQPQGYNQSLPDYKEPSFYHCRKHDYIYYPIGWYDSETGEFRGAGYYDENGAYYPNVAIYNGSEYEAAAFCLECSKMVQPESKTAGIWYCPLCKTQITDMVEDSEIRPTKKRGIGVMGIAVMATVAISVLSSVGGILSHVASSNDFGQRITTQVAKHQSSYYVTELGRECKWLKEYNSYYDPQTDCYFWYNDEINTPQWHYWYEGISSDFGDYGWMEYDKRENCWYIERSEGNWIKLPSSYDTSRLWYIHD